MVGGFGEKGVVGGKRGRWVGRGQGQNLRGGAHGFTHVKKVDVLCNVF